MFMTLFSPGFHISSFFLRGKQLILFFVCSCISWLYLSFLFRRERLSMFFLFGSIFFNTWAFWLGARDLQCLFSAAALFLSNKSLSSGERTFCSFLCASASVCKILIFFSGGRDSCCFPCASALLHKIWVFSLVREIVDSFVVQRHLWLKPVLSFWKRETLDIVSLLWNLFLHFVQKNIQHAFWFELVFKCLELWQIKCNYCHAFHILPQISYVPLASIFLYL